MVRGAGLETRPYVMGLYFASLDWLRGEVRLMAGLLC